MRELQLPGPTDSKTEGTLKLLAPRAIAADALDAEQAELAGTRSPVLESEPQWLITAGELIGLAPTSKPPTLSEEPRADGRPEPNPIQEMTACPEPRAIA